MRCMSALADSTHSVESGHSDGRCKVTVGTSAGRSFFQFEPDLCCECRGAAKKRDGCTASFHGRPVHSTLHMQDAAGVTNAQGAKAPVDPGRIFGARDPHIDLRLGFGCNHVRPRSSADDAGVDGQPAIQFGESMNLFQLPARARGSRCARAQNRPRNATPLL